MPPSAGYDMYILLRIKGVMQSWGDTSAYDTNGSFRGTQRFPSASGVYGLICCCLGVDVKKRGDDYSNVLKNVEYISAVSRHISSTLIDFQTMCSNQKNDKMVPRKVEGGKPTLGKGADYTSLTKKEYLEDSDFFVIIKVSDEFIATIEEKLKRPTWIPYLGRSCCLPSSRIYAGKYEEYSGCLEHIKVVYADGATIYGSVHMNSDDKSIDVCDKPSSRAFFNAHRLVYISSLYK